MRLLKPPMETKTLTMDGRVCTVYGNGSEPVVIVQTCDAHDIMQMSDELDMIKQASHAGFQFCALKIKRFEQELAPWKARGLTRSGDFGDGALETLDFIRNRLLPEVGESGRATILGGYSLGGLFALWSGYQTPAFDAVVGVSPSVWYTGWADYIAAHRPKAKHVYLSLGDLEEKTRNPVFASVGDNIRNMDKALASQGVSHHLDWNKGNHFADSGMRNAKGFIWALSKIEETL